MTEPLESATGENDASPISLRVEWMIVLLISYLISLFSSTGTPLALEILFSALTLTLLYFTGKNGHNTLSGILAAILYAAYPYFNSPNSSFQEGVSLAALATVAAALSLTWKNTVGSSRIIYGGVALAGLTAPLSGDAWILLFLAAFSLFIFQCKNLKRRIAASVLFALSLLATLLVKWKSGEPLLLDAEPTSDIPLTLSRFLEGWQLPLAGILSIALLSAFFLSKRFSSSPDSPGIQKRTLIQVTILLVAAIAGTMLWPKSSVHVIVVPFSIVIGITLSAGLGLFREKRGSYLGHVATSALLLWAILPNELFKAQSSHLQSESLKTPTLVFSEGVYNEEDWGRWTTDAVTGSLYLDPEATPYQFDFSLRSALGIPRQAVLKINDSVVWSDNIGNAAKDVSIRLAGMSGTLDFSLASPDGCVRPSDVSDSPDQRCLAFGFERCSFKSLRYQLGTPIDFSTNATRSTFRENGFSVSEKWGSWTESEHAGFLLELGEKPLADLNLNVSGHFHVTEDGTNLKVSLLANGNEIETRTITFGTHLNPTWAIPSSAILENGQLELAWIFENLQSPRERGQGEDSRKLGMAVQSITVTNSME